MWEARGKGGPMIPFLRHDSAAALWAGFTPDGSAVVAVDRVAPKAPAAGRADARAGLPAARSPDGGAAVVGRHGPGHDLAPGAGRRPAPGPGPVEPRGRVPGRRRVRRAIERLRARREQLENERGCTRGPGRPRAGGGRLGDGPVPGGVGGQPPERRPRLVAGLPRGGRPLGGALGHGPGPPALGQRAEAARGPDLPDGPVRAAGVCGGPRPVRPVEMPETAARLRSVAGLTFPGLPREAGPRDGGGGAPGGLRRRAAEAYALASRDAGDPALVAEAAEFDLGRGRVAAPVDLAGHLADRTPAPADPWLRLARAYAAWPVPRPLVPFPGPASHWLPSPAGWSRRRRTPATPWLWGRSGPRRPGVRAGRGGARRSG